MSNIDKQALREAAEKATPGRIGDRIDGSGSFKYQCFGNDGSLVLQTDHKNMEYGFIGGNSEADELFFRLCDPSTVLALLDELEAKDKRIAELEAREGKPVMFIDGDISSADADKLAAVIREFNEETETPAARMARIIRENPHPTNMCDMPAAAGKGEAS
ncbi:ead/Ea22-like family protein [Enterobacter asburiae]|uniref:ead/Ea22-like family protein n=1 Tax=Enterobacter cloacae complex TaxID=354276 RepID=UPI0019D04C8F|nr:MULTISPECIES: ead/Ea22-like family protein [Enterobacter cloacae complex]MCO7415655.1 ead/Ea22-like family protein [Enterobacter asburiae]MDY3586895.1 ead/Ea22-like family protein [Enterobacter asburiae]UBM19813.1 ead/Ea22-like family protein [Enterobacter cloacae complex sp. ECL352]